MSIIYFLLFTAPVSAVVPSSVHPLPAIPFVMGDCYNKDWGQIHPDWGPAGGWWDFAQGHCQDGGGIPEDYIRKAKQIKVTLDDGRVISKPVGVGIPFDLDNVQAWAAKLNNPEFDNLAFIVAVAPGLYGEVTGGSWCEPTGCNKSLPRGTPGSCTRCFEDVTKWAMDLVEPLSRAFPNIPVFYQGTIGSLAGLSEKAASLTNKNIAVKSNGWDTDVDNALQTFNGNLVGGVMGFASAYHDQIVVGFEPRHGESIESSYWYMMEALSHHPDFFDIQEANLINIAAFKNQYGFPLMEFMKNHMQKTLTTTPDLWVVLRTTQQGGVCGCGSLDSEGNCPRGTTKKNRAGGITCCTEGGRDCCYHPSRSPTDEICTGPQKTNFSSWLYQNDNLSGGKTVAFTTKENSSLSSAARSHPYGLFTTRRTDQASSNPFMYFDVDNSYRQPAGKQGWEITVTFLNQGSDQISLEYYNKKGQTTKQSIRKGSAIGQQDNWIDYKWTAYDADFSSNKFEGKADFRINGEADGDEIIHRVIIKPVEAPLPTSTPTPTQPPSVFRLRFYPGWQKMTLDYQTEIPYNCLAISTRENGFWQSFLSFLGNLRLSPRKKEVWIKCR